MTFCQVSSQILIKPSIKRIYSVDSSLSSEVVINNLLQHHEEEGFRWEESDTAVPICDVNVMILLDCDIRKRYSLYYRFFNTYFQTSLADLNFTDFVTTFTDFEWSKYKNEDYRLYLLHRKRLKYISLYRPYTLNFISK